LCQIRLRTDIDSPHFLAHINAQQRASTLAATVQQIAFFLNEINTKQQIIDLQGDRIFAQSNGG
jgi:hypothetical protein